MKVENIEIPSHCKIIAEIGINHNGDINLAKQLIDAAKRTGCDAVKFQKRTIDIVYTMEMLNEKRESPWGTTQRHQKEGLELSEKEYDEINNYCRSKRIEWFASAWDIKSLEFLDKYKLLNNKIASAMITNEEFLIEIAKRKIHTYISTGMSTTKMIEQAVEIFKKNDCDFTLMHSVSTYPCPEDHLNLININHLKNKFKCKVGYSGHESTPAPSIYAASLGAVAIERHITLDRSMYGSDQSASLEETGLKILVDCVRKLPKVLGKKKEKILDIEQSVAKKLRYWESK
tara:strand:- start:731 stop:1594 length:864 start_codon:yes stop_codon:yes gene_type:complete